jgi:hypothetical protein
MENLNFSFEWHVWKLMICNKGNFVGKGVDLLMDYFVDWTKKKKLNVKIECILRFLVSIFKILLNCSF